MLSSIDVVRKKKKEFYRNIYRNLKKEVGDTASRMKGGTTEYPGMFSLQMENQGFLYQGGSTPGGGALREVPLVLQKESLCDVYLPV